MANKKIWNQLDLTELSISKQDLDYLCGSGLDVGNFGIIEIYSEFEKNEGVVLGYDSDVQIVCLENGEGIFSLEEGKRRFVNSSVKQFSLTIRSFLKYCELVEYAENDEDALNIVNSTINEMKKIDEEAWSDENNYWPIVGQQMIEGNL